MDQPAGSSASPVKPSSGIPRFSRLPTLKPAPASAPASAAATAAPQPGQDAKAHIASPAKAPSARPSPVKPSLPQPTAGLSKRSSMIGTPSRLPPPRTTTHRSTQSVQISNNRGSIYGKPPELRPGSRLARPTPSKVHAFHHAPQAEDSHDQLSSLGGFRAASRQSSRAGSPHLDDEDDVDEFSDVEGQGTPKVKRSSRPSLSDRTIESISRLPPTPSTERRRSGFFVAQSPMGPPSRPASAMSTGMRPGSSDSSYAMPSSRPLSPTKRAPASAKPGNRMSVDYSAGRSTPARRSVTVPAPRTVQPISRSAQPSNLARPSSSRSTTSSSGSRVPGISGLTKAEPVTSTMATKTATAKKPANMVTRERPESPAPRMQDSAKASSSSAALRDQIAKAKAAKRAAASKSSGTGQFNGSEDYEFDLASDPFNAKPKDNNGLLLKRIDAARADGRLNIAAMGLKTIPAEVLSMYDADQMEKSKLSWNETVDLTRLMAADNAFEAISDDIFPDIDAEAIADDDESAAKDLQFRGLEVLDLHGNMLSAIPVGLRRLERLTSVNLSHNKLSNTAWDVLCQLESLEELRLSHNNLTAYLPQGLSRLRNLRTLDLQSNKLLSLPENLRELTNLRVLNVSNNQLTGIPMDALEALPLVDLSVANNAMVGALFGFSVSGHPTLESLDVSNNSLASLAFSETLALPALKILNIANNRIVALPDVSAWTKLATLAAGDNKISVLPTGFSSLENMKHADFTSNEISKLPHELGLMESLESLNIAANPIKERKLLSLTTEKLKLDLRNRLKSEGKPVPEDDFEDEGIDIQSPGNAHPWRLLSGVLDLTAKDLVNEDADEIRSFLGTNHEVRELVLARNPISTIPFEISLAQNLKSLDISNCSLDGDYLTEMVNLQFLKELNISGNKISSWDPLLESFLAPRLEVLDVSNNRLVGSLPVLQTSYPTLKVLHARDNRIDAVSAQAMEGLHAVDLSNNNIGYLPPEIGLLWDQGLRGFTVGGNAFRVPNHRVLEKGTEAILAYLRDKIPENSRVEEESF